MRSMKKRTIFILALLAVSVGICIFSLMFVNSTMDEMEDMRLEAINHMENGSKSDAEAVVTNMLSKISSRSKLLEMLIQHDDLHDMIMQLTDAKVSLSIDDIDDFKKAMSLFYENLEHIRAHERISLSNIL